METDKPQWKRMRFKKNKVWLAVDDAGTPIEQDGKVLIKYQLDQEHQYWVRKAGLRPLDNDSLDTQRYQNLRLPDEPTGQKVVRIFADGASAGNPGPSGIGVVLRYGQHEKEISEYIGMATNNIAELTAIHKGLLALKDTDVAVRIFTDSNYAHGVLALGWKARANKEIVESIKKTMARFKNLKIIKVKGHAGNAGNERADFLATSAIKQGADRK